MNSNAHDSGEMQNDPGKETPLEQEKTMRLGVGDFGDDSKSVDPLANAGSSKKFNTGSLVIVMVILVAFGGLWGLRRLTSVTAASSGSSDVELTIEKFLTGLKGDDGKPSETATMLNNSDSGVLAVLNGSYTEHQIPLNDVQRNPFILYGEMVVTSEAPVNVSDSGSSRQRMAREDEFKRAAAGLHLKSVIMGAEPLANISGKIVRAGEEVVDGKGVAFRVVKITPDGVDIVGEDAALSVKVEVSLALKRFN